MLHAEGGTTSPVNAAERKDLQRATVLLVSGDRSGTLAILRTLKQAPLRVSVEPSTQLLFAFLTFDCERLNVTNLPACICVTRQRVTDLQRTRQSSRGQGTDYPLCDTRTCEQGRSLRERLDPNAPTTWRGSGPGGRFGSERTRRTSGGEE
jgi:hypothetical protein